MPTAFRPPPITVALADQNWGADGHRYVVENQIHLSGNAKVYKGLDKGSAGGDQPVIVKIETFTSEDKEDVDDDLTQAFMELLAYQRVKEANANAPICFPLAHCKLLKDGWHGNQSRDELRYLCPFPPISLSQASERQVTAPMRFANTFLS